MLTVTRMSKTWGRLALPLAGLAALTAVTACGAEGDSTAAPDVPVPTSSAAPTIVAPAPSPTSEVSPAPSPTSPTSTVVPSPTASPTPTHVGLQTGDKGPKVLALQKQLQAMGFWLSAADGSYGQTTEQAVMAFQKATGLGRDGVAGPLTTKAINVEGEDIPIAVKLVADIALEASAGILLMRQAVKSWVS